ncbi:hypothetical protein LOTGIDRAFT_161695 [Lottia gigantea]|uniref:Serine protease n=1 Tax=Lottia gigantea TaxID=225164 RepID=V3ZQB2_LOTGI|nr:hypothetical protein LOTGIDRAFT_161695 [Lottia gigantea]ESO93583.1 hypothetical protein LOTGIDRAFT_161695 [Lottia gigantea]
MAEVATEAFNSIIDVTNCPKNDDHTTPFIRFNQFKIEDLPESIRTEEVYDYLKYLGQTVVRLTVRKEENRSSYGSGVVYRIDEKYIVLTNDHVVKDADQASNTTIEFFYDGEVSTGIEASRGAELKGGSSVQDRCFFKFTPIPQRIQDLNLFNNVNLMAVLNVTYTDGTKSEYLGFPQVNRKGQFILVNRLEVREERLNDIKSCDIVINDPEGRSHSVVYDGISHAEEKVVFVRVKALPECFIAVKEKMHQALVSDARVERVVVTIAHPHGGPKMITFGKIVTVTEEGFMTKLLHTARTCPGSSGGLVVILSKNGGIPPNRGFAPNGCCHCEGDRMLEFRGIVLETQNLNTSLFNV